LIATGAKLAFALLSAGAVSGCLNTSDTTAVIASTAPEYPTAALRLVIDNDEIVANATTQAHAIGGTMPYSYRLITGVGTVHASTGLFTPDLTFVGVATIEATDHSEPAQTATVDVAVIAPLTISPITKVVFIGDADVTFTVTGGRPPYSIIQDGLTLTLPDGSPSGGAFETTADSITFKLPSVEDVAVVSVVDSLFNLTTGSLQVLPQLRIATDSTLFPSTEANGVTSRPVPIHVRGGKAPYTLTVLQGIHDSSQSAIAPVIDGSGTAALGEYVFNPDPFTEQINTPIRIQAKDSNGKTVILSFGVFVPKAVIAGGLHSCALSNIDREGKIKCWGEGIHGQLGYGDDPSAQPYWGDEAAEQSGAADNFRHVEFLSASEKAAGGQILDYDVGRDILCAVVWTGTVRDVRCLGSNTTYDLNFILSGLSVNSRTNGASPDLGGNRFPFQSYRHRYIGLFANTSSAQPIPDSGSQQSIGIQYRFASSDAYLTGTTSGAVFFPRLLFANVLPTSGSYQTQTIYMPFAFGSATSRAPDYPLAQYASAPSPAYQDPTLMTAFSSLAGLGAVPERVFVSRAWNYGGAIAVISTTGNLSIAPTNGTLTNQALLPGNVTYAQAVPVSNASTGEWCFRGTDQRGYCITGGTVTGTTPAWFGINTSCSTLRTSLGAASTYSGVCPTSTTAYQPVPVTTLIGGDADLMSDLAAQGVNSGGIACGIFKGTTTGNPAINLVACWGSATGTVLGNGSTASVNQAYAQPVLCAANDGLGCIGGKLQNATKVLVDPTKGCALAAGRLYCWGGANATNNMIPGTTTTQSKAVLINFGATASVLDFSISAIFNTPGSTACALTQDTVTLVKSLKCWGESYLLNYSVPKSTPGYWSAGIQTYQIGSMDPLQVKIGVMAGCLLPSDRKTLRCWGDNRSGIFGIGNGVRGNKPGDMQNLTPVSLGTDAPPSGGSPLVVSQASAGFEHSCAIVNEKSGTQLTNPRLKCWGSNAFGEMGQSQPAGLNAHKHVGDNAGEMGNHLSALTFPGDVNSQVRLIASGGDHVCAVTTSNNVYCWGDNAVGQLGLHASNVGCGPATTSPYATCSATCGPTSATCSTPQKVTLPTTFTPPGGSPQSIGLVQQIALGIEHSCALFCSDGTDCRTSGTQNLFCWGSNEHGQLGHGNLSLVTDVNGAPVSGWVNSALPSSHPQSGQIVRIGTQTTDTAIKDLPPVDVGLATNPQLYIKQIAAGGLNTCILYGHRTINEFGRLRCFGANSFGQIGIGTFNTNIYGVNSDMGINLADVGYKHLIDFGTNVNTGAPHYVKQVSVGLDFACAVLDGGFLKCWGRNAQGQLGLQDQQDRGANAGEMGENLPYVSLEPGTAVLSVSAGTLHSCAVLTNNRIKCWGANLSGQLGFDGDYGRGAFPFTMGGSLPYCKASFP
jgi:alpha-tubulin suppressor-like RCC1 family protein